MTTGNGKNGKVTNGNGKSGDGVSGKNNNNNDTNKKKKKKGEESLTLECNVTYEGSLTTPPCTQTIR